MSTLEFIFLVVVILLIISLVSKFNKTHEAFTNLSFQALHKDRLRRAIRPGIVNNDEFDVQK